MRWIEMHDVEYGECIVLGGEDRTIFMVDCGSMNQYVRDGEVSLDLRFNSIAVRYETMMDRFFLLTHYHRDHLCGLKKILDGNPGYFSKVYLPVMPVDGAGHPVSLDFALFAHVFLSPQSDSAQVNTACVSMFTWLDKVMGSDRIFTVGAGDLFRFDGKDYQVLWPRKEGFSFDESLCSAVEQLNILFSSPFLPDYQQAFLSLKEEFLSLYVQCCGAFSAAGRAVPEERTRLLEELSRVLNEIDALKPQLNLCPRAHDVREILENPVYAGAYSDCCNASSVVFHNLRTSEAGFEDILMTGDAPPEVLEGLQDELYDGYNILKAPHHGTASAFSTMFTEMSAAHILISNGEYHAGGAIAQQYVDLQDSIRHCTSNRACKWFSASGACCNRLCYCYDQTAGEGLVIKCPSVQNSRKEPGCAIRVVAPSGERCCICE